MVFNIEDLKMLTEDIVIVFFGTMGVASLSIGFTTCLMTIYDIFFNSKAYMWWLLSANVISIIIGIILLLIYAFFYYKNKK